MKQIPTMAKLLMSVIKEVGPRLSLVENQYTDISLRYRTFSLKIN